MLLRSKLIAITSITALAPSFSLSTKPPRQALVSQQQPSSQPCRASIEAALDAAAEKHDLDPYLLKSMVATESGFDPEAVSDSGAVGLMQLMPETAEEYGYDAAQWEQNVLAGSRYLRVLVDRYKNNIRLALAAYNAGPGNVSRYGGIPPFPETHAYVERVLNHYKVLRSSQRASIPLRRSPQLAD